MTEKSAPRWIRPAMYVWGSVSVAFIIVVGVLLFSDAKSATAQPTPIVTDSRFEVYRVSENETGGVFGLTITIENSNFMHLLREWSDTHRDCVLGDPAFVPQSVGGGDSYGPMRNFLLVRCPKPLPPDLEKAPIP